MGTIVDFLMWLVLVVVETLRVIGNAAIEGLCRYLGAVATAIGEVGESLCKALTIGIAIALFLLANVVGLVAMARSSRNKTSV